MEHEVGFYILWLLNNLTEKSPYKFVPLHIWGPLSSGKASLHFAYGWLVNL